MITTLQQIVEAAVARGKRRLVIAYGQDAHSIEAATMATEAGLVEAILVGEPDQIEKTCKEAGIDPALFTIIPTEGMEQSVEVAVKMVRNGEGDVLMKGLVSTDKYMRGILNKEWGLLPPNTTLSHVTVMQIPAYHKLLTVGDVAIIPLPDMAKKKHITKYLMETANSLGIERPKVSFLAPSEQLLPKVVSSVEAKELAELGEAGEFGEGYFGGPLAFDVSINKESAEIKGLKGEVVGDADCILFPNLDAGNLFFKTVTKFAGGQVAAMVKGTTAPCVLTSRGDSSQTKLYSIALACLNAK